MSKKVIVELDLSKLPTKEEIEPSQIMSIDVHYLSRAEISVHASKVPFKVLDKI